MNTERVMPVCELLRSQRGICCACSFVADLRNILASGLIVIDNNELGFGDWVGGNLPPSQFQGAMQFADS
ncbi:MAG: hypothetical protein KZQ97_21675 [Candidatus Thiodiazotropha sp. (ex Dulcina madagascariensis)]|nr:hypothetical protein [Candidatus Thiodiazotropha sp. (ex Dulcina madagascariensis)]